MKLSELVLPQDLKNLSIYQCRQLCGEVRNILIDTVSSTGGHLASNLGVVELTMSIHRNFNSPKDKIVWDVGHQAYVHKLLTGRADRFYTLRQEDGISGFPKPAESEHDTFIAGHSSTSISAAFGIAQAMRLQGKEDYTVAVIGDGAMTGGMVYEGLNDAAVSDEPMIVILNDNEMSIDRNVGGMSRHLSRLRTKDRYLGMKKKYRSILRSLPGGKGIYRITKSLKNRLKRMLLPTTIFENMGMTYMGPVDGHDLPGLITLLRTARDLKEPVLVHVITQKGKGYAPAEQEPSRFHGIGGFDPASGKSLSGKVETYSDAFGETMVELAQKNPKVCAITAAMPAGTGLLNFQKQFPKRTFDVGIAEEHAISMAGGLAKQGMIPVVALYSTFLQRGYDQIMQDIALQQLHVVLAIDRAGVVGDDGPTHHGVFDIGFLRQVPGMTILNPVSLAEQQAMLRWAVEECNGPVAIRYPRGTEGIYAASDWQGMEGPLVKCHRQGSGVTLITYGSMLENVMEAAKLLSQQGIETTVLRLLSVTNFRPEELATAMADCRCAIVVEEVCTGSGIREDLAWKLRKLLPECRFGGMDLGQDFVPHGSQKELFKHCGLDAVSIAAYTKEALS